MCSDGQKQEKKKKTLKQRPTVYSKVSMLTILVNKATVQKKVVAFKTSSDIGLIEMSLTG